MTGFILPVTDSDLTARYAPWSAFTDREAMNSTPGGMDTGRRLAWPSAIAIAVLIIVVAATSVLNRNDPEQKLGDEPSAPEIGEPVVGDVEYIDVEVGGITESSDGDESEGSPDTSEPQPSSDTEAPSEAEAEEVITTEIGTAVTLERE